MARELLARRVSRIGVETLWKDQVGRFFARIENRTYTSEHEIPSAAAARRYRALTHGSDATEDDPGPEEGGRG